VTYPALYKDRNGDRGKINVRKVLDPCWHGAGFGPDFSGIVDLSVQSQD
jgi:hypothetical protein